MRRGVWLRVAGCETAAESYKKQNAVWCKNVSYRRAILD
jgi:hypothetical protein